MGMPPFVKFVFDVYPKKFGEGAVEDLVGETVIHAQYGTMYVESAAQDGDTAALLTLKPGEAPEDDAYLNRVANPNR